jgi:soluble lytic murein transglycosylase
MLRSLFQFFASTLNLAFALSLALITSSATAQTQLSPHDDVFLALREAATQNRVEQVDQLAAQLPSNHPLHAFAEYWKLRVRQPAIDDGQITRFIKRYDGQFVADRLRNDWLLMLGHRADWTQFDAQLPLFALADDPQVDCFAVLSKAAKGFNVKSEARAVAMRSPTTLSGEGCMALMEKMLSLQQFQSADIWDAIHVLAEGKRSRAIGQLAGLINTNADSVLQVINATGKSAPKRHGDKQLHQLALAAHARSGQWASEAVTAHAAVQGAAACALRMGNDCNTWFKPGGQRVELPETLEGLGSDHTIEWAIRGALRAQDWALVTQLTQRLPTHLRKDSAWTYWQAKAMQRTGQADNARALYDSLQEGYGFYHLLAREALGQTLPALPMYAAHTVDEAMVQSIMAKDGVKRMNAFYKMGLRWEGNREWNWMVRQLSDAQLFQYAEAARRMGLLDRMINTAERSKAQIDFKQRFPMPFIAQAQPIADSVSLDSNWVYGLMRQESRFVQDIRSSASARGLMQIMPATAAFVAKKINLPNYTLDRLVEPDVNLRLGHHYLAMVLGDLDNLPVLAAAAYNAGPSRAKTWRASLANTVDGALFAETIPFNETRGYVKNVFANAVLYGIVTGNRPRPLSQWLGVIAPKGVTPTSLP